MLPRRNVLALIAGFVPGLAALLGLRAKPAESAVTGIKPCEHLPSPTQVDFVQELSMAEISGHNTFTTALRRFLREHDCGRRTIQIRTGTVNVEYIRTWILCHVLGLDEGKTPSAAEISPLMRDNFIMSYLAMFGLKLDAYDDGVWSNRVAAELYCAFDAPQSLRDPCAVIDVERDRIVGGYDMYRNEMVVSLGTLAEPVTMRHNIAAMHFCRHLLGTTLPVSPPKYVGTVKFDLLNKQQLIAFSHLPEVFVLTEAERDQWGFFAEKIYHQDGPVRTALLTNGHLLPARLRMQRAYSEA